jgi:hypothetical protein
MNAIDEINDSRKYYLVKAAHIGSSFNHHDSLH